MPQGGAHPKERRGPRPCRPGTGGPQHHTRHLFLHQLLHGRLLAKNRSFSLEQTRQQLWGERPGAPQNARVPRRRAEAWQWGALGEEGSDNPHFGVNVHSGENGIKWQ